LNHDFEPHLNLVISKIIKMVKNFILILPANADVEYLAEVISQESMKSRMISPSCTILIEKIFFQGELKYIVVYMGPLVQN
jgi:hypothetical protein